MVDAANELDFSGFTVPAGHYGLLPWCESSGDALDF
jgi:hypothetical protein